MVDLISVIVPVYNTKAYLSTCVKSIMNQTYKNLEIIIVDDGSSDGSGELCDAFADKDNRIKVIHKQNEGLSEARNIGIENANGKYIAFVDSDDNVHQEYIAYLYELCKKNNADISQCDFIMVRDEKDILPIQKVEQIREFSPHSIMKKTYGTFEAVKYVVSWNKLYSKVLFDEVRFPKGKLHEDVFTTHKLFWRANKIVVSNLYLYYYLQRNDSIIGSRFSVRRLDSIEASREKCVFFKENNLFEEYNEMILDHYVNLWRNYKLAATHLSEHKDILSNIKKEIYQVENKIMYEYQGSLLEKMRIVYPHLDEKKKQYYLKVYGNRIADNNIMEFEFPFNMVEKGERIAIYGAGNVGQAYYRQVKSQSEVELVVWVDNLWRNYVQEGYDVYPLSELFQNEYDKIIIAVRSFNIAEEIKQNLVSWGIDADRIIWELPDKTSKFKGLLFQETDKINCDATKLVLMNTADYGNIGDQFLSNKALEFIKDFFPDYPVVEISGWQWDFYKSIIIDRISSNDIILFVGGGYMGNMWTIESNRVKEIIDCFPHNKCIFLPQSFYYMGFKESESVQNDIKFYKNRNNIMYIHREKNSFDLWTECLENLDNSFIFPDMALYNYNGEEFRSSRRQGIKGCFRLDKEKVDTDLNVIIYDLVNGTGEDYDTIDTMIDKSIYRTERSQKIQGMLTEISSSKLVITDRLHGMLFCAITNTPCIAIDNVSKKISGAYEWIKDLDYIQLVNKEDLNLKIINQFMNNSFGDFHREHIDMLFIEMAKTIKEWCLI